MSGIQAHADVIASFNHLKMRKKPVYNFNIFVFNDKCTEIVTHTNGNASHDQLIHLLCTEFEKTACYVVIDFIYQAPNKTKVLLITWAPAAASVKQKMCASSSATALVSQLGGIHKNIMADVKEDLTEEKLKKACV